jgi:TolB protein
MALAAVLVMLACACSAIGVIGVWSLDQWIRQPRPTRQASAIARTSIPGLIAYVGQDGNIYTMAADGGDRQAITQNRPAGGSEYNTLAWSADGQLAFTTSAEDESALFIIGPGGKSARVYSGNASAAPFYLYWSPDGQRIAFLTPSQRGQMALWLADSRDDDSAQTIATGAPSYFSWSPDSQSLLMHIGGAQSISADARVAIFQTQPANTINLPDTPGGFQAPAWAPDGQHFLLARELENGNDELVLGQGDDRRVLASSRTGIVFNWSPQGNQIAFARPSSPISSVYESVIVLDLDSQAQRVMTRGVIVAFFWSPDGTHLAVLNIDESSRRPQGRAIPSRRQAMPSSQSSEVRLAWSVIDVADGTSLDFPSFRPTDSFLFLIPYFDQYAQSLSLWSPDSRYLVFAGLDERSRPSVHIVDSTQPWQPAQRLAEGTFAIWSWH